VNGSFEFAYVTQASQFTSIYGWNAAAGQIEIVDNNEPNVSNTASDGSQFLELDAGSGSVDRVYQDVQTEAGQSYTLNFDVAARGGTSLGTNTVEVYWNGSLVDRIDPTSTDWETHEFNVFGTGGLDRL